MALETQVSIELTQEEIQDYSAEAHIHLREKVTSHVVDAVNKVIAEKNPTPEKIGNTVREKLQDMFPDFNFSLNK